jgi:hypothetical protein
MTTVAKMIEWLQTLPIDAKVECGVEVRGPYYSYMSYAPVCIDSCILCEINGTPTVFIEGDES